MVYQLSITSIAGSRSFTITFYNRTEKLYLHFSAVRSRTNKELVADRYERGITNRSRSTLLLIRQIINPISQSDRLKQQGLLYSNKITDVFSFVLFFFSFFSFSLLLWWNLSHYIIQCSLFQTERFILQSIFISFLKFSLFNFQS